MHFFTVNIYINAERVTSKFVAFYDLEVLLTFDELFTGTWYNERTNEKEWSMMMVHECLWEKKAINDIKRKSYYWSVSISFLLHAFRVVSIGFSCVVCCLSGKISERHNEKLIDVMKQRN